MIVFQNFNTVLKKNTKYFMMIFFKWTATNLEEDYDRFEAY